MIEKKPVEQFFTLFFNERFRENEKTGSTTTDVE